MNSLTRQSRYPASLDAMRRDLDRWFDQFFSPAGPRNGGEEAWRAPAALWEDKDYFHLEVDLPGVAGEDVDVTYENGILQVTAERKAPPEERSYWHHDRQYGKLQFNLRLPDSVDGENIDAQLKQGVLHVTLTKRPELQPKKITVKATD